MLLINTWTIESTALSPFTSILKLYSSVTGDVQHNIRLLLRSINADHGIFQLETNISGIDALLFSLQLGEQWPTSSALYEYLDNCFSRFVRKSIKYFCDSFDFSEVDSSSERKPVSLFLFVMVEQWPYLVDSVKASDLKTIGKWIAYLLELLDLIGESKAVLLQIRDQMVQQLGDTSCRNILQKSMTGRPNLEMLERVEEILLSSANEPSHTTSKPTNESRGDDESESLSLPSAPPEEPEDHPEFAQYMREDLTESIENGTFGKIILCLCSERDDIRKQAFSILQVIAAKFKVGLTLLRYVNDCSSL